jgi:uncharacterized protein
MQQTVAHIILGNTFLLASNRSIFWQEQNTLILSDLHLGKTGHFRKEGIAVPQAVFKEDMQRLVTLFQQYQPAKVIIIGDMFHSHANKELHLFIKWRNDFSHIPIQLVKGNHDILKADWYVQAGIELISEQLAIGNFIFTHDITDCELTEQQYAFCGHIHPGISIHGVAKQSVHLPCFYFSKQYAVLPAYSKFTGTFTIKKKRSETVFAILPANPSKGELGGIIKIA